MWKWVPRGRSFWGYTERYIVFCYTIFKTCTIAGYRHMWHFVMFVINNNCWCKFMKRPYILKVTLQLWWIMMSSLTWNKKTLNVKAIDVTLKYILNYQYLQLEFQNLKARYRSIKSFLDWNTSRLCINGGRLEAFGIRC